MAKTKTKDRIAQYLAEQLSTFYPEYRDHFLCPTCLRPVHLNDLDNITDAHIIPEAAGGHLHTVLCRPCNSQFGEVQDKWLGELLHVMKAPKPAFMYAKTQRGHFKIDGQRVSGEYRMGDDGGLQFWIWENQIAPGVREALNEKFAERPRSVSITFPVPTVFEHGDEAMIGFLTAGYLLWFRELGYSWALQEHLNDVRWQIQNPHLSILPKSSIVAMPTEAEEPFTGFASFNDLFTVIAAIGPMMVLFPPTDAPNVYDALPPTMQGIRANVRKGHHGHGHGPLEPYSVIYGDRLVVAPDVTFNRECHVEVINPDDGSIRRFRPATPSVPPESWRPTDPTIRVKSVLRRPTGETGRQTPEGSPSTVPPKKGRTRRRRDRVEGQPPPVRSMTLTMRTREELKCIEKQLDFRPGMEKNAPGAAAVMHLSITTDRPVEKPAITIHCDGRILKAIPHASDMTRSSSMTALKGDRFTCSYSKTFEPSDKLELTLYSAAPIHVVRVIAETFAHPPPEAD